MSNFSTFIAGIDSRKILLFEVDIPIVQSFFICHEAGIWKYRITNFEAGTDFSFENGSFCYGSFMNGGTADTGTNAVIYNVSSVTVGATAYTSCASLADLRAQTEGYYYDAGSTIVYIQFTDAKRPDNFSSIELGTVSGFSNQDIYLGNVFYQSKILSAPNISMARDRLFFGLLRYSGGSITLDNVDGYFDTYAEQDLFGQECRIKFGGGTLAYADYRTMFEGYIESFNTDERKIVISIADKKKQIDRTLPVHFFDSTTYPAIATANLDKPIPIAYGTVRGMPVVCTDETGAVGGSFHFKIVDTADHTDGIKAITTVYVNGTTRAPATTDLTTATFTFTVASGFYTAGDDVTCDFQSYVTAGTADLNDNSLDILKDIFTTYLNMSYTSTYFDTTAWAAATLSAQDIGFAIIDNTKVGEIIENICTSNYGNLLITNDGLLTFKFSNPSATQSIILKEDAAFVIANREDDGTEYLTSATVNYYKDWAEGKFYSFTDNTQETTVYNTYKTYRTQAFDTYLITRAQAVILADTIMDEFNSIKPILRRVVSMEAAELELFDTYVIEMNRREREWMGLAKCELTGIVYDFNNFTITLTGTFIEEYDEINVTTPGEWASDTAACWTFPADLGGSSIQYWDKTWTDEQKIYAKNNFSWWCDDDGYVDPTDPDSKVSNWDSD